jgi:hypothetical protein
MVAVSRKQCFLPNARLCWATNTPTRDRIAIEGSKQYSGWNRGGLNVAKLDAYAV